MTHPLFEKPEHTIGELGQAIWEVHDPESAQSFYADYLAWAKNHASPEYRTEHAANDLVRSNIGWFFGEGMDQANIDMWVKTCGASHPVFGNMSNPPTPEEAFSAGVNWVKDG